MKSLQGWKALSRRRGAVSEWHSIPGQFHSFKTVGNILDNAGAVSVWWLWRLFWWFLCFAVPWFRLFCVACSSLSKICLRELGSLSP